MCRMHYSTFADGILVTTIIVHSLVFLFEKHVNRLEVQLTALKLSQTNDGRLPVRFRTADILTYSGRYLYKVTAERRPPHL